MYHWLCVYYHARVNISQKYDKKNYVWMFTTTATTNGKKNRRETRRKDSNGTEGSIGTVFKTE